MGEEFFDHNTEFTDWRGWWWVVVVVGGWLKSNIVSVPVPDEA